MDIQPVWIFRVNDLRALSTEAAVREARTYAEACLHLLAPVRALALYPSDTDERWQQILESLGIRAFYPPARFSSPPVFIHTDLSQPVDLEFFTQALTRLREKDVDVVYASRRHPDARFRIEVRHLRYIFSRYRLSKLFNLILRLTLRVRMEDTHTPHWVTTDRVLGLEERRSYSLFFLTAIERAIEISRRRLRLSEIPCRTHLLQEKNPLDFFREASELARCLPRLIRRARRPERPTPAN